MGLHKKGSVVTHPLLAPRGMAPAIKARARHRRTVRAVWVRFAGQLVNRHQVFSATECSGFFRIAKRDRAVNLAQNEGHAAAVRTGRKRQLCACTSREGSEACGGVPTTAFLCGKRAKRPDMTQAGDRWEGRGSA